MPGVYMIGSVGEQTAISGKERKPIDCRYVVSGRGQYDRRAMNDQKHIRHYHKAASRLMPKTNDGRFDLCVAVNGRNGWHDLE